MYMEDLLTRDGSVGLPEVEVSYPHCITERPRHPDDGPPQMSSCVIIKIEDALHMTLRNDQHMPWISLTNVHKRQRS